MKRKLLMTLLALTLALCSILGLTACGEPDVPEIDYSKYNYYGNYSFGNNLSNAGTVQLNFELDKDNKYKMTLDVYSSNALHLIDVTEEGYYSMNTLSEPIYDETFNTIYMLDFNPSISSGIEYTNPINGYYGYITQVYLADYWWYYIDNYQHGTTVYFGIDDNQYKAEYSKLEYSVTYLAGVGGAIDGYVNQGIAEGEDGVEVTAVADYGYIFDSWSDGVTTVTRKETNVNGDITVTANFVEYLPKYTLTYTCTDGGTLQGELSQTLFQGLDGTIVTAVPEDRFGKEDYPYQFIEWSDGVKTAERTDLNVQGDITVTAIFKPQYSYYGQVKEGAGRVETLTNTANHANNFTVTATAIASEGWVFVEWTDGVKDSTRTDVLTNDLIVEAVFAKEFKLIAKQGGKITVNGQTDTELTLLLRLPLAGELNTVAEAIADSGYTVYGWSKYEDGHYLDSYNAYLSIDYYSNDTTYYALFNSAEYLLNYYVSSTAYGYINGNASQTVNKNGNGTAITAVANEGYKFTGWSDGVKTPERTDLNVQRDITVIALFEQVKFYSFTLYDDKEISTISVQENGVVKLDSITKEGYTFNGWRINGQLKQVGETITISSNTTAYASWTIDTYSITYNLGEGVLENKKTTFTIQDLPYSLPNPIPQGELCFVKWTTDEEGQNFIKNITELKNYEVYAHYENSADFLTYKYNEEIQGFEVSGYSGNGRFLSIPSLYKGIAVKMIGQGAFYDCASLTSIEIPDSVTSIGIQAFAGCSSLVSIEIPDSVTSIGGSAFYGCDSLTSIEIGDSVTSIGNWAFYDCDSLTSIEIPKNIYSIYDHAFSRCKNLKTITFNENSQLTQLGERAFEGCSSLTNIVLPDSLPYISNLAFSGCTSLISVVIPDSVTSIGWLAFSGCSSLMSVVIPESITDIMDRAFEDCNKLKTMVINSSSVANDLHIASNIQYCEDIYIRADITVSPSVYTVVYDNLGIEEIDGVEYYHYRIKE